MGARISVIAALAWAMLPGVGVAQQQTGAVLRHACAADYARHCAGEDPPSGLLRACISQYYVNLSPGCQSALDAARAADQGSSAGQ